MSLITFSVVDPNCEPAISSQIPPVITLSAVSTTSIATIFGYPEWVGFASSPPKKYHTIQWSGSSEQQLWVGGVQIGGARYDYSGADTIDTNGNITSTHIKNYSNQCNGDSNATYSSIVCNHTDGSYKPHWFKGYFGMTVSNPGYTAGNPQFAPVQKLCVSSNLPYSLIGNVAVNGEQDNSDLWGGQTIRGTTNEGISTFSAVSSVLAQSVEAGTASRLAMPYLPVLGITPPGSGPTDFYSAGSIIYNHNYTAVLLTEYTDAEALANANVSTGNSTTAQNLPRTTGFVSTFSTVVFSLFCSNLVGGQKYIASVSFADLATGVSTSKTYTFVAIGATNTITDTVPTPLPGHSVTVRLPSVALSP